MKVSIIIPSFNGASRFPKILKAIQNQTVKVIEIIIVVDGSTDNSIEILNEISMKNQINVIYQENSGRAKTRNRGAEIATGDLLIFYDDDMRPCADSIARHIDFHQNYSNAICGGNQLEDLEVMKSDIQLYKAHLSRKWTAKYNEGLNLMNLQNLFLTAANMSISKVLFDSLGGFNEKLSDAEDHELAVRAYEKGIPVYFDKSNIAWHDDFITCKRYIQRQRQYNQANRSLQVILLPAFQRSAGCLTTLPVHKRIIYNFFSLKFWVIMADKEWLIWLPKNLRNKIYDIIITGLGKYYPQRVLD